MIPVAGLVAGPADLHPVLEPLLRFPHAMLPSLPPQHIASLHPQDERRVALWTDNRLRASRASHGSACQWWRRMSHRSFP